MPYLNWKERKIRKRVDSPVAVQTGVQARATLSLELCAEDLRMLMPALEDVFQREGVELRLDLEDGWVIFWKTRDAESRLLLAHPEPTEWVATVALEPDHGGRLLGKLKEMTSGDALSVSEFGAIGSVSNVEIILTCNG